MKKTQKVTKLQAAEAQIESMRLAQERLAELVTAKDNANTELRAELDLLRLELRNTRTDRAILIRSVHFLTTGEPLTTTAIVEG